MSADPKAPEYKEAERRTANKPGVPTPQVRAAVTRHNVLSVLIFGLVAVVVAFLIVYLIYF
jgi:hypothetical protein